MLALSHAERTDCLRSLRLACDGLIVPDLTGCQPHEAAYGSQKQLHSEHEKIAVWVVAGIVLVMGIAAIAGMLR